MFIRYADHLLAGDGLSWNPGGPPVNGITGLFHLAIVTVLRALTRSVNDGRILQIASFSAALFAVVVLAIACARFTRVARLRNRYLLWLALIAVPIFGSATFRYHAFLGMDTMSSLLANALLCLATLSLVQSGTKRAAIVCAIAAWFTIFARPDNAFYAIGCPILAILLFQRPLLLHWLVPFSSLLVSELLVNKLYLGTALPLSYYAKRPFQYGGFVGEYTWNPFLFLECFLGAAIPWLVLVIVFARKSHARLLAVFLIPTVLTCAAYFHFNQIMGHLGRFYFPSLAFVVVAAVLVLDGESLRAPRASAGRLILALAMLQSGAWALDSFGRVYERRAERQPRADLESGFTIAATTELPILDSWESSVQLGKLAAAAPEGTVFAASEHGLFGARAPRAAIIDVVGLHDPWFALHGFDAKELFRRAPDFIWLPHWDYTQMIRDLLDSDELWSHYDYYPNALTYGVAIRRDGPRAAALQSLFADLFKTDYPDLRQSDYLARRAR